MKTWFLSKTVWLGIATTGVSFLTWLAGQGFIQDNPTVVSIIGAVIGIVIIYLRTVTTQPLG